MGNEFGAIRRRLLAAILCCVAGVLVIVATVLPLLVGEATGNGEAERVEFTSWGLSGEDDPDVSIPTFGYPMVLAAVVLLVAAGALLVSTLSSARLGNGRVASVIGLAGSAMLVGLTWAVLLHETFIWDAEEAAWDSPGGIEVDMGFGAGFWLLAPGVALAVVATVLAMLPGPRPLPTVPPADLAVVQPYPADWPAATQDGPTQVLGEEPSGGPAAR